VLLIEDDAGDAMLVSEELSEVPDSPRIEWAQSLHEASESLRRGVECVLLDLDLPDATGLDGLRAIREQAPDTAVIVLTGRDDERMGIQSLGAGAQDYLVKGRVDGPLLVRAIRYAIERGRAEREARELHEARLRAQENRRLERGLLPTLLIADPTLELATGYRPGRGGEALLSGDFFDVAELPDGSVHAVIGDVSGHSAGEAALGVCLRIAWRTLSLTARDGRPPLLRSLEQLLVHERQDQETFATVCAVSISPDRRELEIRLAGHPLPILLDERGAQLVPGATRPPVGLSPDSMWPSTRIEPQGNWSLLLYTDGLIEGRLGGGPERLGAERLLELVRELLATGAGAEGVSGQAFLDGLIERVSALGEDDPTDDMAALWLRVRA
jgi:serine phosphatase RsbU (regulator of sigma subunit)